MPMDSLQDLYMKELRDMYNAEKQILRVLPKMAKAATNEKLQAAFTDHREVTEEHVRRLETIFDSLGTAHRGKRCAGMEGIIEEGAELLEEEAEEDVMDAGLIAAAQRVEHYEMAAYGTLRTFAAQLGRDEDARLLQQTLDEEGEADKLLSKLAETQVNRQAVR
jgi:ferritin-like metal-binding protein YciE